ncbi:MAG TPA: hypothetical protein DC054_00195 [Blastocatellia bacterium]|nr:hypothetical protein [Blastocatellia bacterium]
MTHEFGTRLHATDDRRRKDLTDRTSIVNWILTLGVLIPVESSREVYAGSADVFVRNADGEKY